MNPILPPATIGLLGGGQLGRMFALVARRLGYRVHTFDPLPDSPTGQVSDKEITAEFLDYDALLEFASGVDVMTYEFENIPIEALDQLAPHTILRPGREILFVTQNRRREKEFLSKNGFPCVPYEIVSSAEEVSAAVKKLGTPCVLKTADFGYDGKGQQKIDEPFNEKTLWQQHGAPTGIIEKWVEYEAELSVIVARNAQGETSCFPVIHNHHENHILSVSVIPAPFPEKVIKQATEIAVALAQKFELIGLLAVEMFLSKEGDLLVNELAPRPHNSGHLTIDACITSQFEQQLRAVCGFNLGSTEMLRPALMRNLLGDLWSQGEPDWSKLLSLPGLKLHLYGKREARPGRKMGHYTITANSLEEARHIDDEAQKTLLRSVSTAPTSPHLV